MPWPGPSPRPCGARAARPPGAKAPGQRPPRPWRALRTRRDGRWPLLRLGKRSRSGRGRGGRGKAMPFLIRPARQALSKGQDHFLRQRGGGSAFLAVCLGFRRSSNNRFPFRPSRWLILLRPRPRPQTPCQARVWQETCPLSDRFVRYQKMLCPTEEVSLLTEGHFAETPLPWNSTGVHLQSIFSGGYQKESGGKLAM
jgi:hypothetical protein